MQQRKTARVRFQRSLLRGRRSSGSNVDESAGDWSKPSTPSSTSETAGELSACEDLWSQRAAVPHCHHAVVHLVRRQIARLQAEAEGFAVGRALLPHVTPLLAQLLAPLLALLMAALFSLLGAAVTSCGLSLRSALCPPPAGPRTWWGRMLALFLPRWVPSDDSPLSHPF